MTQATGKSGANQTVSPPPGIGPGTQDAQQICLELDGAVVYYSVPGWACAWRSQDKRLLMCMETQPHGAFMDFVIHGKVRGLLNSGERRLQVGWVTMTEDLVI